MTFHLWGKWHLLKFNKLFAYKNQVEWFIDCQKVTNKPHLNSLSMEKSFLLFNTSFKIIILSSDKINLRLCGLHTAQRKQWIQKISSRKLRLWKMPTLTAAFHMPWINQRCCGLNGWVQFWPHGWIDKWKEAKVIILWQRKRMLARYVWWNSQRQECQQARILQCISHWKWGECVTLP